MTRYLRALGIAALLVFAAQAEAARPVPAEGFADLVAELSPAVVSVLTTQERPRTSKREDGTPKPFEDFMEDFFRRGPPGSPGSPPGPRRGNSLGSGFIIDPSGLVVTNKHVVEGADSIKVQIGENDEPLDAEIVGHDSRTDIALLKVKPKKPLPSLKFGNSDKMRVGDWVLAIGNPFGYGGTVTVGIVSAVNRDIRSGPYDDYIQTDAAINRGNSGGPLFNTKGEVIGINTVIISPGGGSVGVGFAIPAALAQEVIAQLRTHGETRRGWLGVAIQDVTDEVAQALELKSTKGALVADVYEDSPADKAGIKSGDVIIRFNGDEIGEMRDLPRLVARAGVGKSARVGIIRNGRRLTRTIKLGRLEDALDDDDKPRTAEQKKKKKKKQSPETVLGLALAPIDEEARRRYELSDDVKGVLIVGVKRTSAAARRGIRPGQVILKIGRRVVRTAREVESQIKREKNKGRKAVLLLVHDKGQGRFVTIPFEEDDDEDDDK